MEILKFSFTIIFCLGLLAGGIGVTTSAKAATIPVDDFSTITNGVFHDIVGPSVSVAANVGGVAISTNHFVGGSFTAFTITPSTSDPGNGQGWVRSYWQGAIILNFDTSIAAFGASFLHYQHSSALPIATALAPVTIEVFDGLDGTGTSLGTVMSSGATPAEGPIRDFVGIWSDTLNIQSAQLSSSDNIMADGYGLSLTSNSTIIQTSNPPIPNPEPSSILLFGTGLAGLVGWWKRKRITT